MEYHYTHTTTRKYKEIFICLLFAPISQRQGLVVGATWLGSSLEGPQETEALIHNMTWQSFSWVMIKIPLLTLCLVCSVCTHQ